jgi:putative flippase GtrA
LRRAVDKMLELPWVGKVLQHRFLKFGTVGFSGTMINLIMLYINQEYIFRGIEGEATRLHVSLCGAIFVATLSNFLWNRRWTWVDRKGKAKHGFLVQLGQYFLASGVAICIQYVFTILFAHFTHYLLANIMAVVIAAVFTYLVNDVWTFAARKGLR